MSPTLMCVSFKSKIEPDGDNVKKKRGGVSIQHYAATIKQDKHTEIASSQKSDLIKNDFEKSYWEVNEEKITKILKVSWTQTVGSQQCDLLYVKQKREREET